MSLISVLTRTHALSWSPSRALHPCKAGLLLLLLLLLIL
jgi:hypothetical protein